MLNVIRNTVLTVIVTGLCALQCTMPARAHITFQFRGPCSKQCSGTATGVLTLTDGYVFGSNITAANFVSFSYTSSALNFTIPAASNPFLVGGLYPDGSINTAGELIFQTGPLYFEVFVASPNSPSSFLANTSAGSSPSDVGSPFAFTLALLPPISSAPRCRMTHRLGRAPVFRISRSLLGASSSR